MHKELHSGGRDEIREKSVTVTHIREEWWDVIEQMTLPRLDTERKGRNLTIQWVSKRPVKATASLVGKGKKNRRNKR